MWATQDPPGIRMTPRISIITPSFQQARFLPWTIESVLSQGYGNLEYLIADGGSTDGSTALIESIADRLSWWCSEPDKGQSHAINKAIAASTGDVIGWVNSDDMLLPGCLHAVAHAFQDPRIEAICGWGVMMSESGHVLRRWVFPQPTRGSLLRTSVLFQPAVFWRRSVVDRIGPLDESLALCMDQEYFARMANRGILPILLPRFLAAYRRHGSTKTHTESRRGGLESRHVSELYCTQEAIPQRRLTDAALRFFWHKATIMLPPYARGTSVHRVCSMGD